jgi:Na+/proline symporter
VLHLPICFYFQVPHTCSVRTLIADYVHTAVLYAIILAFAFIIYTESPKIGSPRAMYDLLTEAAARNPVEGNAGGSYLTMKSRQGCEASTSFLGIHGLCALLFRGVFAIINLAGNFSTVFRQ